MSNQRYYQLKGGLFTLTVLHLQTTNFYVLEEQLKERIAVSPEFFNQIPIIVDLLDIRPGSQLDFNWLRDLLIANRIIPVALRNIPEGMHKLAYAANWAEIPDSKYKVHKSEESIEENKERVVYSELPNEAAFESTLITRQVRSGQQIFRPKGDIVIANTVNTGAELLADGNIHVYGTLRGRALAGINGNIHARIFCHSLEAELISIAGKYKVIEEFSADWSGKAVQIYLENDELKIEQIN